MGHQTKPNKTKPKLNRIKPDPANTIRHLSLPAWALCLQDCLLPARRRCERLDKHYGGRYNGQVSS